MLTQFLYFRSTLATEASNNNVIVHLTDIYCMSLVCQQVQESFIHSIYKAQVLFSLNL